MSAARNAALALLALAVASAAPAADEPRAPDGGATDGGAPDAATAGAPAVAEEKLVRIDPRAFEVVRDDSGPVNYYTVVADPEGDYIRSAYEAKFETTTLAWPIPEKLRKDVVRVRWRWRALTLPQGGNECQSGKNDSAAVVYLTFKRGWNWYGLKYVWSSVGPRGATCDKRRNLLRSQDTIVVESGGPVGEWRTVEVDPQAEFRRHFDKGRSTDPPDFMGIGIMSDGDQTHSASAADFGGFVLTLR
ncbi:MAG TPA: DUF3047 domain-containing protein [Anaeromyxobacteraceae bacterium]|nr:DUF3047 domain-containing protein [Anaeromyxobacteraceae bacterium]